MGSDAVIRDPFAHFEREHDEALAALSRLEGAVDTIERVGAAEDSLAVVRDVLYFVTTAVRAHNENEERTFFGLIAADAPVHHFAEEHLALRALETELTGALQSTDPTGRIPPVARNLIDLLRDHIERENQVLFPMARAYLGEDGVASVARRLETAINRRHA